MLLVLGGLGLPVPEEAPIILAAVLSRKGTMLAPLAFGSCLFGVLLGDFLVYFLGYVYGEKVMSLPLTRKFLTRARETQMQGYFHRHGFKILILGRFAVGFRTAAYLTAGILKLPVLRLFLTDLLAATLSTSLMFGIGYVFAQQIETSLDKVKYWLTAGVALAVALLLFYRFYKARQNVGLAVGPKVLESGDLPLPPDDLHSLTGEFRSVPPVANDAAVSGDASCAPVEGETAVEQPIADRSETVISVVSPEPGFIDFPSALPSDSRLTISDPILPADKSPESEEFSQVRGNGIQRRVDPSASHR